MFLYNYYNSVCHFFFQQCCIPVSNLSFQQCCVAISAIVLRCYEKSQPVSILQTLLCFGASLMTSKLGGVVEKKCTFISCILLSCLYLVLCLFYFYFFYFFTAMLLNSSWTLLNIVILYITVSPSVGFKLWK